MDNSYVPANFILIPSIFRRYRFRLFHRAYSNMSCAQGSDIQPSRSAVSQCRSCSSPATTVSTSLFTTDIVTLIVGGPNSPAGEVSPVKFYIHRSLLTESSTFFRAMLGRHHEHPSQVNGNKESETNWLEAQNNIIQLPEDRVADWEMMCQYLYSEAIGGDRLRNRFSTESAELLAGEDLLDGMISEQPGLDDEDVEHKIRQYLTWKSQGQPGRSESTSNPNSMDPPPSTSAEGKTSEIVPAISSAMVDRKLDQASDGTSPPGTLIDSQQRPSPPSFGPLIRLYILADKYAILQPSLKQQISLRISVINRLAHIVPDHYDIERIWTSIPLPSTRDSLKSSVLEVFAKLKPEVLRRILHTSEEEADDECEWNADFLKDLLLLKATRGEKLTGKSTVKAAEGKTDSMGQFLPLTTTPLGQLI